MTNIIERAVSKAAGGMGAVQAKLNGLEGVFVRLVNEHKQLQVWFARAEISSDAEKRAELWPRLRAELVAHEFAEAHVVYRVAEAYPDLGHIVRQHQFEEELLHSLVHNLDVAAFSSGQWEGSLKQLEQALLLHARREERAFFPELQARFGQALTEELDARYVEAKKARLLAP